MGCNVPARSAAGMNPNQRHVMPASYPGATGYFRQRSAEIRYRVCLACESFPRGGIVNEGMTPASRRALRRQPSRLRSQDRSIRRLLGITPRYCEVAEQSIED
jgi:hypothetical protein